MAHAGFEDAVQLHRGPRTVVYRARRSGDHAPVVLKTSAEVPAPERVREQLRHEFDLLSQFDDAGIVTATDWIDGPDPAIVLEDHHGRSLAEHLSDQLFEIADVLDIGEKVAAALASVHAAHVIHRDICPANIVWNPESGDVELIDFDASTTAIRQHLSSAPVNDLIGTLPYLPPEQSGRMNRAVDTRSDLYGLGATLFHLVAGRPPFVSELALDVVHAHLAREAPDLSRLRPDVPPALAEIIAKLLAKNADDRYQSAGGLLADLRTCRQAVAAGNTSTFRLGRSDHAPDLRLPDRTVGRDHELATLRATFERVCGGRNELVLVRGFPGIGKTRYVNELQPEVATRRGFFLAGKFDQFQRATPYAAVLQALDGFARAVLAEPDRVLETWRSRLRDAVGEHGRLLADASPPFAALLGDTPRVERLPPQEGETRFALLLRRVVQEMGSPQHPVVLFLDDLQWADLPSLNLLRVLVTDPQAKNTLLVGAFRDNELRRGDPLLNMATSLREAGGTVQEVGLAPLSDDDVTELCASAFGESPGMVAAIAEVLADKSRGNPFALGELLAELHRSGMVRREVGTAIWRYDLDEVRALPYSDDVVRFVAARLSSLTDRAAELLSIGSMLGPSFDLADAASLAGASIDDATKLLTDAISLGAVERVDEPGRGDERISYRFTHDHVQQAAASVGHHGAGLRLRIAELLGGRSTEGTTLFDVVEHAIAARALIEGDDRLRYADLAVEAGTRAKTSAAFEPALRYFLFAWDLLPDPWERQQERARQIALEGAEAAYLVGDDEQMGFWTDGLLAHDADPLTRIRAEEIVITNDVRRQRLEPAIIRALGVLREVGVSHPENPSKADLLRGVASTRLAIGRRSPAELAELPLCTDDEVLAAMRLQVGISSAAYYARPDLLPLIMMSLVKLSVKHGLGPESAYGFAGWGLVTSAIGNLETGKRMGEAALAIDARLTDRRLHHRTVHLVYTHVYMWHEPWRRCRDELAQTHIGCWQGGDVEFAAFSAMMTTMMAFAAGDQLDVVADRSATIADAVRSLGNDLSLHTLNMIRQMVAGLRGESADPSVLVGDIYHAPTMTAVHEAANDATSLHCQGTCESLLALYLHRPDRVLEIAERMREYEGASASSIFQPLMVFVEGLANAMVAASRGGRGHVRAARKSLATLEKWVDLQPLNYRHRAELLRAQIAAATDDRSTAMDEFEAAIASAERAECLGDLALACELAGRHQDSIGHDSVAASLIAAARGHYERWGAVGKVDALDGEFPFALAQQHTSFPGTRSSGTITSGSTVHGTDVDVAAILAASSAISRNVDSDGVLDTLLALSVELAGASRGVLLLVDDEVVSLHAEATADERVVVEHLGIPFEPDELIVPEAMVAYVLRAETELIVGDVETDPTFVGDRCLAEREVRSAMCVPVSLHGNIAAILYVENALTPDAFTERRLAPVQAVVAQAAISLENARVYESLEERVRVRSAQLVEARKDVEAQRDRADSILSNVLPEPIAAELKRSGRAAPASVEAATVLFTDFVGFTQYSGSVSPETLVDELERCFTAFDEILDERGVTKLKTIGDAYMAVGGLPRTNTTHALDTVSAALDIVEWMDHPPDGRHAPFGIRIGVHTGPLVAGVIGRRRFLYDVWGDTVNVAARLESAGEPGRVNVSASTKALVEGSFACTPRGEIPVKGKGPIEMFFVERR